jgi:hypothetical protein
MFFGNIFLFIFTHLRYYCVKYSIIIICYYVLLYKNLHLPPSVYIWCKKYTLCRASIINYSEIS